MKYLYLILYDMLSTQFLKTYCHQKFYTKGKVLMFTFSVNQNISHTGFGKILMHYLILE